MGQVLTDILKVHFLLVQSSYMRCIIYKIKEAEDDLEGQKLVLKLVLVVFWKLNSTSGFPNTARWCQYMKPINLAKIYNCNSCLYVQFWKILLHIFPEVLTIHKI